MEITRSSIDTQKGPEDWFTSDVYIDAVAAPSAQNVLKSVWLRRAARLREVQGVAEN